MSPALRLAVAALTALGLAGPAAAFDNLFAFPDPEPDSAGPLDDSGVPDAMPSLAEDLGAEELPEDPQAAAMAALDRILAEAARAEVSVPATRTTGPDEALCLRAIREAERAQGIPQDLLVAIGLQEAGMNVRGSLTIWPWSVNVEGRGYRFDTRAEAEAFVTGQLARGVRSIDVGCLQVNLLWHPEAFPSPTAGFDPDLNALYAAGFLRRLHDGTGDWLEAAGRYHSATPGPKAQYQQGVQRQLARLETEGGALDALALEATSTPLPVMALPAGVRVAMGEARPLNPLRMASPPESPLPAGFRRLLDPVALAATPASDLAPPSAETASAPARTGWEAELSAGAGPSQSIYGGTIRPLFASLGDGDAPPGPPEP